MAMSAFASFVKQAEEQREQADPREVMKLVERKGAQKGASKGSIAETILKGIKRGHKPKRILADVLKKHQGANTTIACVYWYQSRVKRGLIVI